MWRNGMESESLTHTHPDDQPCLKTNMTYRKFPSRWDLNLSSRDLPLIFRRSSYRSVTSEDRTSALSGRPKPRSDLPVVVISHWTSFSRCLQFPGPYWKAWKRECASGCPLGWIWRTALTWSLPEPRVFRGNPALSNVTVSMEAEFDLHTNVQSPGKIPQCLKDFRAYFELCIQERLKP